MEVDELVSTADDLAVEPLEQAEPGEPGKKKHKQKEKDKEKKKHKHKHKKEKHKGEPVANGNADEATATDEAPPASDPPTAAPTSDVAADALPAADTVPADGASAAPLTAEDTGPQPEAADAAALLPSETAGDAASAMAVVDRVQLDGSAPANGAPTAAADDVDGSDRESGELDATGPGPTEAGAGSDAARAGHANKAGKERSKHRHESSERKRDRPDGGNGKHASKRSRHDGEDGDAPSKHGSHSKRLHREGEGDAKTAAADGVTEAARETDAAAGDDVAMEDFEGGPMADAEAVAEPAANGAVADAAADAKRRDEGDAKRDRGASKGRGRERSGERSERRREEPRDRSRDRRRDGDAAGDRGVARDADRHRSRDRDRDRERDSERERERRDTAEREKALLEARLAERKRERERREKDRERDGARPSARDSRDADRRDPRDRDRDGARGRYDRREPYGGRDYRQGRDADRGYRDGRDRGREIDRDRGRDWDRDDRRDRDRDRGGRRTERDEEEAPIDPEKEAQLLAALEQDSSDEEAKAIEDRRRRMAAIKAKHQAAKAVSEPTATALAAAAEGADPAQPSAAATTPAVSGPQETPETLADQPTPDRPEASGAGLPRVESRADSLAGAQHSAPPTPRSHSEPPSDSDDDDDHRGGQGDGEMDIWQRGGDDAGRDAGQPGDGGTAADAGASGSAHQQGSTSQAARDGETRGADVSEAEFASEAQKAQEQTQAGRQAATELDMFAEVLEEPPDGAAAAAAEESTVVHEGPRGAAARAGLADSFDDKEGYYTFTVGEVVDDRYEVFATHGRGVFSSVLRARDLLAKGPAGAQQEVAIKIIRANETMYKAGQTEKVILRKLGSLDPEGKRHVIRVLRHFDYRGHLCLVFEPMAMNLREITKKVGRNIGLNLPAVQLFAKQLLLALHHFRDCGVLHADIKPDNILINDRHNAVKVCDFGSAMFEGDNAITPYLVSRFYRPPEVILGLPYGYPLDMWSIGCVVYELFTGRILFNGRTNNEMLKKMMDVKGPFPKRMLKKGAFTTKHFESDPGMSFKLYEDDPVTGKPIVRLVANPKIVHDFAALFRGGKENARHTAHLADLLEKMLALDPDKRIRPKDALKHPFVKWGRTVEGGGGLRR